MRGPLRMCRVEQHAERGLELGGNRETESALVRRSRVGGGGGGASLGSEAHLSNAKFDRCVT